MAKPTPVHGLNAETPREEAAAALLAVRLGDVSAWEPAAATLDRDAVHEMRVGCRRLRIALDELAAGPGPLERATKRLQDALGSVRDLQQLQRRLGKHPEARPFLDAEERTRAGRSEELHDALARFARAVCADPPRPKSDERPLGGGHTRRGLERWLRDVKKKMGKVDAAMAPVAAHRLRIAAKKLRYRLELYESAFSAVAEVALPALVKLQDVLGDLHDADLRVERLERAGVDKLAAATRRERRALAHAAFAEIERWRAASFAIVLRAALRHPGMKPRAIAAAVRHEAAPRAHVVRALMGRA